ncbi:unnamed protein product [Linum trigynum]|uniref:Uncharacterized protein n=1 Tax=Linum trigynum TaxID=586398 RepID=A0AAV2GTR5_9ROSI
MIIGGIRLGVLSEVLRQSFAARKLHNDDGGDQKTRTVASRSPPYIDDIDSASSFPTLLGGSPCPQLPLAKSFLPVAPSSTPRPTQASPEIQISVLNRSTATAKNSIGGRFLTAQCKPLSKAKG